MLSSGLDEHANYYSEEPRNLWHFLLTSQLIASYYEPGPKRKSSLSFFLSIL